MLLLQLLTLQPRFVQGTPQLLQLGILGSERGLCAFSLPHKGRRDLVQCTAGFRNTEYLYITSTVVRSTLLDQSADSQSQSQLCCIVSVSQSGKRDCRTDTQTHGFAATIVAVSFTSSVSSIRLLISPLD